MALMGFDAIEMGGHDDTRESDGAACYTCGVWVVEPCEVDGDFYCYEHKPCEDDDR